MHHQLPLLVAFLLLLDPVLSVDDLQVIFTTNVTAVRIGQPFTARCQVVDYEVQPNEWLTFAFWRKNRTADEKLIEYDYDADGLEQQNWNIETNHPNHADLTINLQPTNTSTYPTCQVTMRSSVMLAYYEYYCTVLRYSLFSYSAYYKSNHINVSVYPPPDLMLTSTHFYPAYQPLPLTCHLFDLMEMNGRRNYSIQFFSDTNNNTLLATYRVIALTSAKPVVVFNGTKEKNITVTSRMVSPDNFFSIKLNNTQTNPNQSYWCTLLDDINEQPKVYKSNVWQSLNVTFTANVSTHQNGVPFTGRCFADKFIRTNYSVDYYAAQFGLLATFSVQPSAIKPDQLTIQSHHYSNMTNSIGGPLNLRTYDVSINITGPMQAFWCLLKISENGQMREFKSNEVIL